MKPINNYKILVINNAFPPTQIAFGSENKLYFSIKENSPTNSPNNILYVIDEMLSSFHMDTSYIDAISVVKGPGSFTGTRIAVVEAKIMAYSLSIPLISLNSMELIGNVAKNGLVVLPAGRKQFFISEFVAGKKVGIDRCVLAEEIKDRKIYTTSAKVMEVFDENNTEILSISGETLIKLSSNKLKRGEVEKNPLSVAPVYLRSTDVIFKKIK